MSEKFKRSQAMSELTRQLRYSRTMFGRMKEKHRRMEAAYEAKILGIELQLKQLEAEESQ